MSNDQTHDDLDPIVEKIRQINAHMGEIGTRIDNRDAKYHTGGSDFLLRMAMLMKV